MTLREQAALERRRRIERQLWRIEQAQARRRDQAHLFLVVYGLVLLVGTVLSMVLDVH